MKKQVVDIIKGIPGCKVQGDLGLMINDITADSRKAINGFAFVAVKGTKNDGHNYIPTVTEQGCKVIFCQLLPKNIMSDITYIQVEDSAFVLGLLASEFYNKPSHHLNLVGVTGTNGKTTTATLLYRLFSSMGYKCGLISTIRYCVAEKEYPSTHTTPDQVTLNKLIFEMVEEGCEYCFMEVSSHAIDQKRISGLKFKGAIFSNLTRDHLDYHGTFQDYRDCKKKLFDDLSAEAFALVNIDDKNGLFMLQNTKAEKYTFSSRAMADFRVKIEEIRLDGMILEMLGHEVWVQFTGRFNASNLLSVAASAILLGANVEEVLRILSVMRPADGRFEAFTSTDGVTAIVDYAHTPDALSNVISTINDVRQSAGRLITVVGAGGNRDKGKRPLMAKEAVNGSDLVILTSDNPRFEVPGEIIKDMEEGLTPVDRRKTLSIEDRLQAIKTAVTLAVAGDVILVAGKGHEDYQEINGVKHHFDDREIVKVLLNERTGIN